MRREITFVLILMLVVTSLAVTSKNVSAQIKKEDMTWSIGDKWEFRYTTISKGMTMIFRIDIEIKNETTIDIDGVNYEVFVADLDGEVETIDNIESGSENLSFVFVKDSGRVTGKLYMAKDSDTTKTIQNIEYQLKEETTDTVINQTINLITISRVISGEKPDIIDVGTNWVYTTKTETTTTTTVSGSFYDEYIEPGYTNTTTTTSNSTETTNYECLGKKTITTAAGTFETYEIKINQVGQQGHTLQYKSSKVKEDVKQIIYDNDGSMISLKELISYDVASSTTSGTSEKTPGFELVIILFSIAFILLWKRKTKY